MSQWKITNNILSMPQGLTQRLDYYGPFPKPTITISDQSVTIQNWVDGSQTMLTRKKGVFAVMHKDGVFYKRVSLHYDSGFDDVLTQLAQLA